MKEPCHLELSALTDAHDKCGWCGFVADTHPNWKRRRSVDVAAQSMAVASAEWTMNGAIAELFDGVTAEDLDTALYCINTGSTNRERETIGPLIRALDALATLKRCHHG